MRCEVKLFKAGTVFSEVVIARDYEDAKKVALARNPGANIVSVNAKFYCGKYGSMHWGVSVTTRQLLMTITLLAYAPLFLCLTWLPTFLLLVE